MLTVSYRTHPGAVRPINEDSVAWEPDLSFVAIADGMGGHNAGEVASKLAIDTVRGFLQKSASSNDFTWPFGVHIAVVEIERDTGDVRLRNVYCVDDVGNIISPMPAATPTTSPP